MRARKQNTIAELEKIQAAIEALQQARDLAIEARVSKRSIDRIRSAIKSLAGAERHASGSVDRELAEKENRESFYQYERGKHERSAE